MKLDHGLRLSLMICPRSFQMGFEPLSEASFRALQLPASFFLVVLARAESLRKFLALSIVLPCPMVGLHDHLLCTCSRHLCLALYPSGWASTLCLRLLFAPCSCRRVYWWSSRRPRVFESSGLSLQCSSLSGVPTPVSRMFLCLRPSRSHSPFPSLAPSWWSPCSLWRRALLPLSCYVLSVRSAFFFASVSFVAPVRIVAPLAPCLS